MKSLFSNPLALFYAIIVHAVLAVVLFVNFDWSWQEEQPQVNVVKAVAVDESKVKKQIENLKKKEELKKRQEEARKRKLEKQAREAEKRRIAEEKRLAQLEKKKQQELEQQKDREKQRKVEEKRLADLKIKQEQERQQKQKLERERKAEEQRLAKAREEKQRLEEQRKKDEDERQRKEEERRRREEEEALLMAQMKKEADELRNQQLQAEEQSLAEQKEKEAQTIVAKYSALIKEKVERYWRQSSTMKSGLKCTVSVSLIPSGDVVDVTITESSGDARFDRSVEAAVYNAQPLPLPADPGVLENFRKIRFVFDPSKES
ncbi:cell envelope integrity protein TolA [Kaarinaea lacus]